MLLSVLLALELGLLLLSLLLSDGGLPFPDLREHEIFETPLLPEEVQFPFLFLCDEGSSVVAIQIFLLVLLLLQRILHIRISGETEEGVSGRLHPIQDSQTGPFTQFLLHFPLLRPCLFQDDPGCPWIQRCLGIFAFALRILHGEGGEKEGRISEPRLDSYSVFLPPSIAEMIRRQASERRLELTSRQ